MGVVCGGPGWEWVCTYACVCVCVCVSIHAHFQSLDSVMHTDLIADKTAEEISVVCIPQV